MFFVPFDFLLPEFLYAFDGIGVSFFPCQILQAVKACLTFGMLLLFVRDLPLNCLLLHGGSSVSAGAALSDSGRLSRCSSLLFGLFPLLFSFGGSCAFPRGSLLSFLSPGTGAFPTRFGLLCGFRLGGLLLLRCILLSRLTLSPFVGRPSSPFGTGRFLSGGTLGGVLCFCLFFAFGLGSFFPVRGILLWCLALSPFGGCPSSTFGA